MRLLWTFMMKTNCEATAEIAETILQNIKNLLCVLCALRGEKAFLRNHQFSLLWP
jgi:hypothetical protein